MPAQALSALLQVSPEYQQQRAAHLSLLRALTPGDYAA